MWSFYDMIFNYFNLRDFLPWTCLALNNSGTACNPNIADYNYNYCYCYMSSSSFHPSPTSSCSWLSGRSRSWSADIPSSNGAIASWQITSMVLWSREGRWIVISHTHTHTHTQYYKKSHLYSYKSLFSWDGEEEFIQSVMLEEAVYKRLN